jgi:hypothetical protein
MTCGVARSRLQCCRALRENIAAGLVGDGLRYAVIGDRDVLWS